MNFFDQTEKKISQTSKTNIVEKEEDQIKSIQWQDFIITSALPKLVQPCYLWLEEPKMQM
jgi:hypothetical protein